MLLVLFVCFLLFLYVVYYLSRDDFVLARKDIPLARIFNTVFLGGIIALFFARLVFVLSYPTPTLLNPLGFLAFYYYGGLSLIGAMAGTEIFIYLYSQQKKLPSGKIFDIFSLALMAVLPLGLIGALLLHFKNVDFFSLIFLICSLVMLVIFMKVIYPFSVRGEIKDGSLGFIFVAIFSFLYFLIKLFLDIKNFSFLSFENILLLVLLFSSLVLLLNQEIMDKFLGKK